MTEKLESLVVVKGVPVEDGRLKPAGVHAVEALLRSWGLGDRHAMVVCAWVAADALRYLAQPQLPSRQPETARGGEGVADDEPDDLQLLAQAYLPFELGKLTSAPGAEEQAAAARQALARAERCIAQCANATERRQAIYALAVASVFAKATGADPNQLAGGQDPHAFEQFLLACLRLILPLITREAAKELSKKALNSGSRRFHA